MADDFYVRDFNTGAATLIKGKEISAKKYPGKILYDEAGAEILGLKTASPDKDTIGGRLKDIAGDKIVACPVSATTDLGTGATGDYLKSLTIVPVTTAAGNVQIKDSAGGTAIDIFTGGGTLADLKSWTVNIGARSQAGKWQVVTGANVKVVAAGRFT